MGIMSDGLKTRMSSFLVKQFFTDTCTIYHKDLTHDDSDDNDTPGEPTDDGRGGYDDERGGVAEVFDDGVTVPCRMDTEQSGNESSQGDQFTSKLRRVLYIPVGTEVGQKDEVETTAGEDPTRLVRYQIVNVVRETDQLDVQLDLLEKKS
jgi:hypothetical protein